MLKTNELPGRLCATLFAGFGLALALLSGGCHSRTIELYEPGLTRLMAPQPPPFLAGPVATLLTNNTGFDAVVTMETVPGPGPEPPPSGHLLGLNGKLLFAPTREEAPDKKARPGGFSFLWDVAANQGYLLSEALQGYAPLSTSVRVTNMLVKPSPAPAKKVAGYSCVPEDVTFQTSDGLNTFFQVMRGVELNGFPIRISAINNSTPLTVTLSKIRLRPPSADLFSLPQSFTKYSSPEAMVDELAIRDRNERRKPAEVELERPLPPRQEPR